MTISGPDNEHLIAVVNALLIAAAELGMTPRYETVVLRLPIAGSRRTCMCLLNLSRS